MVDGLNREDPGWRLLARVAMQGEAGRSLWMHTLAPDQPANNRAWRACLDVRELDAESAQERCVGPHLVGEPDPLLDVEAEPFDTVAYWPRAHLGKDFSLACFGRAALCMREGASIYVAGRKQKGIKSLAAALESLFGDVETVQRERGYHLLRAEAGPGLDRELARSWMEQAYTVQHPALDGLSLLTAPGVFSRRALDGGTRALIEFARAHVTQAPRRVLDLCAGVGPLGLWAATHWPQARVRLVESNLLAAHLCRRNADAAGLSARVQVDAQAGLEAEPRPASPDADSAKHERFGVALVNPPTHASPALTRALLAPLRAHLVDGGSAYLVVNRAALVTGELEALGAKVSVFDADKHAIVQASWA